MGLDLPTSVSFERLQAPFESASDALARFDERLRSSPVADAFILRAHLHDACAALWRAGEFAQLEDLISFPAASHCRLEKRRMSQHLDRRRRPSLQITYGGLGISAETSSGRAYRRCDLLGRIAGYYFLRT